MRIAPFGRERAVERDEPAHVAHRILDRADHRRIDEGALGQDPVAERLAGDGRGREVEFRAHALQEPADAAGGEEILHVALARRLQVDEDRRLVGEAVEAVKVELEPEPSGHRGKMHDGVGRARDREQRPDRVVDAGLA